MILNLSTSIFDAHHGVSYTKSTLQNDSGNGGSSKTKHIWDPHQQHYPKLSKRKTKHYHIQQPRPGF